MPWKRHPLFIHDCLLTQGSIWTFKNTCVFFASLPFATQIDSKIELSQKNSYQGHQQSNPELKEAVSLSTMMNSFMDPWFGLLCSHQLHLESFSPLGELWGEGPWNLVPRFSLTVQVLDWTLSPQTTRCIPYPPQSLFFFLCQTGFSFFLPCSCLFLANSIQFQVDD